jgi:hypothetical protein
MGQLVAVRQRITQLEGQLRQRSQEYERAVKDGIARRVAERAERDREIGLLERMYALRRLVNTNFYLAAAEWLLRAFFVMIDCLPLLAKTFGGTTSYDRLLDLRTSRVERIFGANERNAERRVTSTLDLELHRLETNLQLGRDVIDRDRRTAAAADEAALQAEIDRLTEQHARRLRHEAAASGSRGRNGRMPSAGARGAA